MALPPFGLLEGAQARHAEHGERQFEQVIGDNRRHRQPKREGADRPGRHRLQEERPTPAPAHTPSRSPAAGDKHGRVRGFREVDLDLLERRQPLDLEARQCQLGALLVDELSRSRTSPTASTTPWMAPPTTSAAIPLIVSHRVPRSKSEVRTLIPPISSQLCQISVRSTEHSSRFRTLSPGRGPWVRFNTVLKIGPAQVLVSQVRLRPPSHAGQSLQPGALRLGCRRLG